MKAWVCAIGWLVFAAPLGHAEVRGEASRPLVWAADAEGGAPYVYPDPQDPQRQRGFEVELAGMLEKELGQRIEFRHYQFGSLISGLLRGDFDFAMNGVEVTPDRKKTVLFTRPYYVYTLQLVARADERRFDSLESCQRRGCLVGTLEDTAASRLLEAKGIRQRVYDDNVNPYQDLALGRLDAVLLDLPIALYYARPNKKLKFVGGPLEKGYYAIAVRKDQQALVQRFNDALTRLAQTGQLERLYRDWGLWNDQQQELVQWGNRTDVVAESGRLWTFARYFPLLLDGALVTVGLTVGSMCLAMAIGLPLALVRLYGPSPLRWLAVAYIEFFRGIPVFLLLFFLYYGLPGAAAAGSWPWDLKMGPVAVAILGFGLNYAAYEAEIYRAGVLAVPRGQWEAAASLGMSRRLTFLRVILPQAIRLILPPSTNDLVALFKDTSLVSVIAVVELTKQYQVLSKSSLKYLEIGVATALLYLLMSVPLGHLSRWLERRWGKGL